MSRHRHSLAAAALVLLSIAEPAAAEPVSPARAGPADDPHRFVDYGGTPDVDVPEEMGLSVDEIGRLLERLKSPGRDERAAATREIIAGAAGSERALREVLWGGHGARNSDMKDALKAAARIAAAAKRPQDLLYGLLEMNPAETDLGRGAAGALRVYTLLEALDGLGTLAGYKVMIEFSPRHAGVFRLEIGALLVAHGLDVLPALIYSRSSPDPETHMFAVKWIRDLGDPLLSEQVKIVSPRRLAQLLEAYAAVNDLGAVEVTLALANHDSAFVRAAARRCLARYERNALWPVRRLYENTFSKEPPVDAVAGAMLEELYEHFDEQRLAGMTALFEKGLGAFRAGDLDEMVRCFRAVLRDEPTFPRRSEMASGFIALGERHEKAGRHVDARVAMRMAERVAAPGSREAVRAAARLAWLEAEDFRRAGVADKGLYEKVLSGDPDHDGARTWLARLTGERAATGVVVKKAILVSFVLFLAAVLVFLRLRTR